MSRDRQTCVSTNIQMSTSASVINSDYYDHNLRALAGVCITSDWILIVLTGHENTSNIRFTVPELWTFYFQKVPKNKIEEHTSEDIHQIQFFVIINRISRHLSLQQNYSQEKDIFAGFKLIRKNYTTLKSVQ